MKTKIVLWGKREDEKVLTAIELIESENTVKTHIIKEEDATELFYNRLLNEWRFGEEIEFPENIETTVKDLSISEDILPDGLLVERPELITRAKTEWHFIVLSKKLYDLYQEELTELNEKIDQLEDFSQSVWTDLKSFWTKVQNQIKEKNLFRKHGESLRRKTDELFGILKELKKKVDAEFREESTKQFEYFSSTLNELEEKIEKGLGLQPLFEELKVLQRKFKNVRFDRDHRRKLWDRIDAAFKNIKEKRFGSQEGDRTPLARVQRRYEGLLVAIEKMERSIARDKKEAENPGGGEGSFGQLEMEIRKVKLSMVEDRIKSKEEKLEDMMKTKVMLENKIVAEKEKEEKKKQFEEAKKEAKEKIEAEIQAKTENLEDQKDDLLKAAEIIAKSTDKTSEDDQSKEDETVEQEKAVEEEKDGFMDKAKEKAKDIKEDLENVADTVEEKLEDIGDKLKERKIQIEEDMKDKREKLSEKWENIEDKVEEKMEVIEDKLEGIGDTLKEKAEVAGEKLEDLAEKVEDKVEDVVENVVDKVKSFFGKDEEE